MYIPLFYVIILFIMKKLLLGITLFLSTVTIAQSVSPEVIASAGAHFAIPTIQMSWTLGEPITQTFSNGSATLTQGFQQSNISLVSVENLDPLIEIRAYPNPISDFLTIELSDNALNSEMQLIDATGKVVLLGRVTAPKFILDFTAYSKGTYYLNFKNENGSILHTITLQKIN